MTQSLEAVIAETNAKRHLEPDQPTVADLKPRIELIEGEPNRTVFLAMAEWYDRKRDRAVFRIAALSDSYAKAAEKSELTANTPEVAEVLKEVTRSLADATLAQTLAAKYRKNSAR